MIYWMPLGDKKNILEKLQKFSVLPWQPNLPKIKKAKRLWVFIVLGIYTFEWAVRTGSPSNSDRNWHRKNAILPTHRTHHLHLLSITVICHDLFVISVSPWKIVSYSWHFFQVILRDQPIMLLTTLLII